MKSGYAICLSNLSQWVISIKIIFTFQNHQKEKRKERNICCHGLNQQLYCKVETYNAILSVNFVVRLKRGITVVVT